MVHVRSRRSIQVRRCWTSAMSASAISSERAPAMRTRRKSVSAYCSQGASRGRWLHSRRSQGSGTVTGLLLSSEVDLRRLARFHWRLEERVILEAEYLRGNVAREPARLGVVLLNPFVVPHALGCDPVFRTRQLVHEAVELLVRPELRVVLDHRQQAA